MRYEGIFFLIIPWLSCFAAGPVFKWKIDKYLMAISSSHKDTEV